MRKNNCEVIRRELDELMLDEAFSTSAVEHLNECSECREFHQQQTKLRRMVGSLGTVAAPPDFDFRLRARLANDSGNSAFHYWPLVQKGFAVAAVLIVLAFGVVVVRNVVNQPKEQVADQNPNPPVQKESPKQIQTTESKTPAISEPFTAHVPSSGPDRIKSTVQAGPRVKRLSTVDSTFKRAEVIS